MEWFLAGGFPMVAVVVFGLMGIVNAAHFARVPGAGRVGYLTALGLTQGVAAVGGVATNLMAVATRVPAHPEWVAQDGLGMVVLVGVGESLTPLALACGGLTAQGLLVALGLRRAGA